MRVYSYDTELLAAGAKSYRLATHGWWFSKKPDGSYDTSHVDLSVIEDMIHRYGAETSPLLIDIEAYNLETELQHATEQLRAAAEAWRAGSQRQLGFYGLVPERSWWIPVGWWTEVEEGTHTSRRLKMQGWRGRNDLAAQALWSVVDFFCPSIYAFYPDKWQQWRQYAECNIDEAVRVSGGKPVWPILYPSMPDATAIPLDAWEMMVTWTAEYPNLDGLMIHSPRTSQMPDGWRDVVKTYCGA